MILYRGDRYDKGSSWSKNKNDYIFGGKAKNGLGYFFFHSLRKEALEYALLQMSKNRRIPSGKKFSPTLSYVQYQKPNILYLSKRIYTGNELLSMVGVNTDFYKNQYSPVFVFDYEKGGIDERFKLLFRKNLEQKGYDGCAFIDHMGAGSKWDFAMIRKPEKSRKAKVKYLEFVVASGGNGMYATFDKNKPERFILHKKKYTESRWKIANTEGLDPSFFVSAIRSKFSVPKGVVIVLSYAVLNPFNNLYKYRGRNGGNVVFSIDGPAYSSKSDLPPKIRTHIK